MLESEDMLVEIVTKNRLRLGCWTETDEAKVLRCRKRDVFIANNLGDVLPKKKESKKESSDNRTGNRVDVACTFKRSTLFP
jgi:hypothetical protein